MSLWVSVSPPLLSIYLICVALYLLCSDLGGGKIAVTVGLPCPRVKLVGAEVAKESLCCMVIFPQNIFFVCLFPRYLAPRHLLNPLWDGHVF